VELRRADVFAVPFDAASFDHVLVVDERHLRRVLREDVASYGPDRPRRSPGLVPPPPGASPLRAATGPPVRAVARPVPGGLPHADRRAA
jgi:hypothetical protein